MDWSAEQLAGIDRVAEWFTGPEQVFYLAGNAGTGKTTVAQEIEKRLGVNAVYGAYTGKAAYVMLQKGCLGATTIHKLIYQPKDKSKKRLLELQDQLAEILSEAAAEGTTAEEMEQTLEVRRIRDEIESEEQNLKRPMFTLNPGSPLASARLTILDECSMIDERVAEDLLSFGTKVLVLGDPAQLPPVAGTGYFTSRKPDYQLREIHRQARGNPIIHLATSVREGRGLRLGEYGESQVIPWNTMPKEVAMNADQILVGTNKLRRGLNAKMREFLGRSESPYPITGDKLVCLRNNHELGLLNGSLWEVVTCVPDEPYCVMELFSLDNSEQRVVCEAHSALFLGEDVPWYERKEAQEFDFGYALTVHKSQGSQWDHVLVLDESWKFRDSSKEWLYTAITRAAKSVTIMRK